MASKLNSKHALIIANSNYKFYPKLDATRKDAINLENILKNKEICGYNVKKFLDISNKVFLRSIKDFLKPIHNVEETVLLYFSGHGTIHHNGNIYLTAINSDPGQIFSSGIKLSSIFEEMNDCCSDRQIVVLDCCFGANGTNKFEDMLYDESERRIVLTACNYGEQASTECYRLFSSGSSFTKLFIEGIMNGNAAVDDTKNVTIPQLSEFISKRKPDHLPTPMVFGIGKAFDIEISNNPRINKLKKLLNRLESIVGNSHAITDSEEELISYFLAKKFKNYGLNEIKVVNVPIDKNIFEELGARAAEYLNIHIKSNKKVAISCGRTLLEAVSRMERKPLSQVVIYPLTGHLTTKIKSIDSNILTGLLMTKLSGPEEWVDAHLLPISDDNDNIRPYMDSLANSILDMASDSDIFIFGIGNPFLKDANIGYFFKEANLTREELKRMEVAGEIMYHIYNGEGKFLKNMEDLDSKSRAMVHQYYNSAYSLKIEHLDKIKGRRLIAIAGGDDKFEAITGAIKTGLIHDLVTDLGTAINLLKYDEALPDLHKGSSFIDGQPGGEIGPVSTTRIRCTNCEFEYNCHTEGEPCPKCGFR